MLKLSFALSSTPVRAIVVLTVAAGGKLGENGAALDQKLGGAIKKALRASPSFKGERGQTLSVLAPAGKVSRLVLAGIGIPGEADARAFEEAGGAVAAVLKHVDSACVFLDTFKNLPLLEAEAAAHLAFGARLRAYRFDKYRTRKKADERHLAALTVASAEPRKAKKIFERLDAISQGVFLARDLISEPPNVLDPQTMMRALKELQSLGVKVDVLDRRKMEALGMGSLLSVAQGSVKPPYLVTLSWQGHPKARDKRPLVLVGKGVTFDTGGICLKGRAGMDEMKFDMAGAAAVAGTIKALALRKAKVNVAGVVGLVENMPDGNALRPGDIVTSAAGLTIEVLNTDAEGRLVLADALWYAQEKFNPRGLIDLATLTYVMIAVVGRYMAGMFPTDEAMAEGLLKAGLAVDEPVWRFPMGKAFAKMVESDIADLKNVSGSPEAQSVVAAEFLHQFVKNNVPWVHLDLGVAATFTKDRPTCPKGASGFGVRLLERFIADTYE